MLGKPAYRLRVGDDVSSPAVRDALQDAAVGSSFVDAKIEVDRLDAVAALQASGFLLVDTNVVLELLRPPPRASVTAGVTVRDAQPGDAAEVRTVARSSFAFSRFHLDPQVPKATADELKAEWVGNFFTGARGDHCAVAVDPLGPCAFLLALTPRLDEVVIDLVAVASRAQRQGVGAALVRHIWEAAEPKRVTVGTQLANVTSLRFYESLGFRMRSASYVFHRHGTTS
jgi:ribosomal protein S18 acetylase RimI-like enzyme